MSVHNPQAAGQYPQATEYPANQTAVPAPSHADAQVPVGGQLEFPRHIVTAVLVSHDGARWLPSALSGLLGQERPVQNVIAADTGSSDDSVRILTESLGAERVLHLARRTGFGTAVHEAATTAGPVNPEDLPYLRRRSSGWDPATRTWRDDAYADEGATPAAEPVQWLWLLHDDCEPEPDALAELLRVADSSPSTAVVGPKLRSWYDRRQLLEVGVSIARSGRRWTGLERREQDQGQHDQVRPVLSVSSAGMLVRRDVWEELGGFDPRLPLMRDDVDFCWRVHSAGYRVLIAPDAVLRHAEAAARERRPIDCAADHPHRVDKAGAAYTLLANAPASGLPFVFLRLLVGTLLRTVGYLVGKVPGQALDEVSGLSGVLLRPYRLIGARRRRSRPQVEPAELRPLFPPPGATVRLTAEQLASNLGGRRPEAESSGGRHGAVESGPGDDDADFLEVENFARLKRIARKPAPVLFAGLLVISLIACRDLLAGGALAGGAMLPTPNSAFDLWGRIADGWHAVGTGGTASAPPYLAVVAALGTVLFGDAGLAVTALLVGAIPLAGLTAYFASRPLVDSRALRAWAAVTYALLPAATGALAAGRLGTAVLAALLPLLARVGIAATGLRTDEAALARGARPTWRSAWSTALLLTIATAFTPVVWPIALILLLAAVGMRMAGGQGRFATPVMVRSAAVLVTPMVLLAPWSLGLLSHPSRFLLEAGLPYAGGRAPATDLVLLNPGGPGTLAGALLVGVLLAALGALLRSERRRTLLAAWAVALTGLVFALPMNASQVTPAEGIAAGPAWAGPALLCYGLGLLCAVIVGAEGLGERVAGMSFGWRQPAALLVGVAAAAAPLIAAGAWMVRGAADPLQRRDPVQVPAFVAEESSTRDQARTLVLRGGRGSDVSYALVRGSGVRLGDAEIATGDGGDIKLSGTVSNLLAGSGADQATQLAGYAVRYVLVQGGAKQELSRVLDSTPGLTRLSQEGGTALWRVDRTVARLTIRAQNAAEPVTVASGPVEAHTDLPAGGAGRVLRLADTADSGWQATLDGQPLDPTTVDGWAQGFELPAGGGRLDLTHETAVTHTAWVWMQGFLALLVLVLALPGRRREVDDDLPEAVPAAAAGDEQGEGRRARRLKAQAEAAAQDEGRDGAARPRLEQEYAAVPGQQLPADSGAAAGAAGADYAAVPQQDPHEWDAFQQGAPAADPYAAPAAPYGTGQYPAQPYQSGDHQSGDYQAGGYPAEGYPATQYQAGGYQDQQVYPAEGYPADPYGAYGSDAYAQPQSQSQPQSQPQQPYQDPAAGYGGDDPYADYADPERGDGSDR